MKKTICTALYYSTLIMLLILHWLFPTCLVVGESMYPTYTDGDIVIGSRFAKPSEGDVVVLHSDLLKEDIIKRADVVLEDKIYVLGDNSEASFDSRMFGFMPINTVKCVVYQGFTMRRFTYNIILSLFVSIAFISGFSMVYVEHKNKKKIDSESD